MTIPPIRPYCDMASSQLIPDFSSPFGIITCFIVTSAERTYELKAIGRQIPNIFFVS